MSQLPKQYNPQEHEAAIYQRWESSGAFAPNQEALNKATPPFVIMLPPPNVTGTLHMGHALQDTIMDILVRYHRMNGQPVLWQPGTDHAALPTNKLLIDQLQEQGKTREDLGRDGFEQFAQEWYEATGAQIIEQMKRLGCSADWSRLRFTMDEEYYQAVQEAFVRYYEKGYIYRGARIVNWDPKTQTTVSDLEIDWVTEKTPFYYFQYGPFEIGTARPETKFGDKYVVMHPTDERYQQYQHGDTFEAEWINGKITATIIKDEAADPTFGSGVMTITPWHDTTDFQIAQRHNLDMTPIIDLQGKLLPIADEFSGMNIKEARPPIVEKLKAKGLLLRVDEEYEHNVARNNRGQGVIEPQVMRQWFVDMSKLKQETIDVVQKELVQFAPPRWKKHFVNWMENVLDWNINRQIWLGHRLPVWWKPGTHGTDSEEGNFVVSMEKPSGDYEQDPDVLDTWFSSALWPFATLDWPAYSDDLKTFYPTSVLVTARDIVYLWVARMIFSGLELMSGQAYGNRPPEQRIPFRHVFIHPTVLTHDGKRMSKSLGTGVDPLKLIEQYGADATRFGLMYQMSYDSQAIKFDEETLKSARNFTNKLWNLARLIQSDSLADTGQSAADVWIAQQFNEVRELVYQDLESYKVGEAARRLYQFVWSDFADWYVEIAKHEGSRQTARDVFVRTLQLIHPFMPHVTEVLWESFGHQKLLVISDLAQPFAMEDQHTKAGTQLQKFKDIVTTVRSARALLAIPPSAQMQLYAPDTGMSAALAALTRTDRVEDQANMTRFALSDGSSVGLASDYITPDSIQQARDRLNEKAAQIAEYIERQEKLIAQMRGKAPAHAVADKEAAVERAHQQLAEIKKNLASFT